MPASPEIAFWESGNLEEHVALIQRQFKKSLRDPELRQLALKVIGHKPDDYVLDRRTGRQVPVAVAWGEAFQLPQIAACGMKDAKCESQAIWDFCVMNVRYVLDPDGYDMFSTAKYTLLASGGDCDDFVILLGAMHRLVGFQSVVARVVSANGRFWEHVYLLVGFPKSQPRQWVALDPTVKGAVPGWQFKGITHYQDFPL